ncbi:nucleotide-binding alpha-beta plait domain-containing protein [Tanacetum coccineum]
MLHEFNVHAQKMCDLAYKFETKNDEQTRISITVDAIKNRAERDPTKTKNVVENQEEEALWSSDLMGSHRSKDDEVQKISASVFIINFPDSFSARDLFKTCSIYGNMVDAYIPNKRSKARKRFGFVRFIKVFNMERLVNNLCTVWVGRYRLHANTVRFERTSLNHEARFFLPTSLLNCFNPRFDTLT